ncbi:hypothetical protein RTBOTA2_002261, partial [Rhodotorula toruloides]
HNSTPRSCAFQTALYLLILPGIATTSLPLSFVPLSLLSRLHRFITQPLVDNNALPSLLDLVLRPSSPLNNAFDATRQKDSRQLPHIVPLDHRPLHSAQPADLLSPSAPITPPVDRSASPYLLSRAVPEPYRFLRLAILLSYLPASRRYGRMRKRCSTSTATVS